MHRPARQGPQTPRQGRRLCAQRLHRRSSAEVPTTETPVCAIVSNKHRQLPIRCPPRQVHARRTCSRIRERAYVCCLRTVAPPTQPAPICSKVSPQTRNPTDRVSPRRADVGNARNGACRWRVPTPSPDGRSLPPPMPRPGSTRTAGDSGGPLRNSEHRNRPDRAAQAQLTCQLSSVAPVLATPGCAAGAQSTCKASEKPM